MTTWRWRVRPSADLTYRLSARDRTVRPYAALGGGVVLDLAADSQVDPIFTMGAGVRVSIRRLAFLFTEARLQWVPSMPVTSAEAELVLPLTVGLGIGY